MRTVPAWVYYLIVVYVGSVQLHHIRHDHLWRVAQKQLIDTCSVVDTMPINWVSAQVFNCDGRLTTVQDQVDEMLQDD